MKIQSINTYPVFKSITEEHRKPPVETEQLPPIHKKSVNPVSLTGWIGAAALLTSIVSGIKRINVLHKISAYTAVGAIAGHIGLVKSYHHAHKHACCKDS